MSDLAIRLLGPFQATLDSKPLIRFETEKVRALLAYLAAEAEQPQRREFLAEMLWPGRVEGAARANLRHALGVLRTVIGDRRPAVVSGTAPPFLLVTRETIQFNLIPAAWVDTVSFGTLLPDARTGAQPSISQLEEALKLYRAAFVEDIFVGDSNAFQEWVLLKREQFRRRALNGLHRLIQCYEAWGEYAQAQEHAWRLVELAPLDEGAHRQLMRLLALVGKRGAALAQYEACRSILAEELDVEPAEETTELYRLICDGKLESLAIGSLPEQVWPPSFEPPGFLKEGAKDAEPPLFVGREPELERLFGFLEQSLNGHGRLAFVTGGPGRGKTALMAEFARRAMHDRPGLLAASGTCTAFGGLGDPYQPFRDAMVMLTGDVEAHWASGAIRRDHARRLWGSLALATETLLECGPSLIGAIVPGGALSSRVATAFPDRIDLIRGLQALAERPQTDPTYRKQSHLFEQYTNVLRSLSERHPLLLLLDDIHWADGGSIALLFHLGKRLATMGSRILIVCAYRPEEVDWGRADKADALAKALREFKRTYGDVWVDLTQSDQTAGRRFVDVYLDTQSNQLGERFRAALFQQTGGHPLFTIELLRAMQERGDLIRDANADGAWIEGPELDWETLPARVEAVIEQRVERLDAELQAILTIASVEGEVFTAQVVAEIQGMEQRALLKRLSGELERRHRLVREQGEVLIGMERLARYKFGHALIHNYLYKRLSQGERRLLHGQIATSLAAFYSGQLDVIAGQLAHHFHEAGDYGHALRYFTLAGEHAARIYANHEAIAYYTKAIGLAEIVSLDVAAVARLYCGRGEAYEIMGDFDCARADHEEALRVACSAGERHLEWRALLTIGRLWSSRDYERTLEYYEQALELARQLGDRTAIANSLNQIGNWYLNADQPRRAIEYHLQALEICSETGDRPCLASTLDMLGITNLLVNDLAASLSYYDQAVALYRELNDRPRLVSSLTGRGFTSGVAHSTLTAVPVTASGIASCDFDEALRIARQIDSPPGEAWALWAASLLHSVQGQFGLALETAESGLSVASEIGHLEWTAGSRHALGLLFCRLFAPKKAERQLKEVLRLGEAMRSQHWIHNAIGGLAVVYILLDDLAQAQSCLERVVSPQTPMDTMVKRYCWARRAEVALAQGQPAPALEIADRLIKSAPGMTDGQVITFLWKVRAEALAAMGHADEACTLLRAAIENAQHTKEQFLLWRVYASLGRLLISMDLQTEAEEALSMARTLIEELAATIPEQSLQDSFLAGAHKTLQT